MRSTAADHARTARARRGRCRRTHLASPVGPLHVAEGPAMHSLACAQSAPAERGGLTARTRSVVGPHVPRCLLGGAAPHLVRQPPCCGATLPLPPPHAREVEQFELPPPRRRRVRCARPRRGVPTGGRGRARGTCLRPHGLRVHEGSHDVPGVAHGRNDPPRREAPVARAPAPRQELQRQRACHLAVHLPPAPRPGQQERRAAPCRPWPSRPVRDPPSRGSIPWAL